MIDEKVLIERLEEMDDDCGCAKMYVWDAIQIVNQLAEESNLTPCYLGSPCEYQNKDAKMPMEYWNNVWIPCSERLPKKDEYVLCSLNENNPTIIHTVIIARYDGADYWHNGIVLAWQPLPAPFKQKE